MTPTVTPSTVCLGCGCTCDDIVLHIPDEHTLTAEHACRLGQAWFDTGNETASAPAGWIGEQPVTLDAAIQAAAQQLTQARRPLITGLGESTVDAQRQAVHLAETLGGVIDSLHSEESGPILTAAQLVGKPTCTLGEVRNRADLILLWGVNPTETHPRLLERYTSSQTDACSILTIHSTADSSRTTDREILTIRPGCDFEILTAMRAMLQNRHVEESRLADCGITISQLQNLLTRIREARYGVLFFGEQSGSPASRRMTAAAFFALAADLNAHTRFSAIPLRRLGNAVGLDQVLGWTTGYSAGVDFSRGYPRANPGEFTTHELLTRQEVDAVLVIGRVPAARLCGNIPGPVIALSPGGIPSGFSAAIRITTATNAVSGEGTVYRMDTVPLPLRSVRPSRYPTEADVLHRIREAVVAVRAQFRLCGV